MLSNFTRAGIVAVAAGFPVFALAQVKDVTPYPAVIITPSADMHAGDTSQFYRVGAAVQGVVVVVDGESPNWSRVSYPPGSYAFVPADDASYNADTKQLKLVKASRLRAPNPTSGYNGSWKALLTTALPAGTSMNVLQVEDGGKGSGTIAYRVAAPADARAFTESKNVRKATEQEISAFRSKGGNLPGIAPVVASAPAPSPAPTSAATTPAPAAVPPAPVTATMPAISAAPKPEVKPEPKPEPKVDTSLVSPVNTTGTAGAPPAPAATPTPAPVATSVPSTAAPSSATPSSPAPVTIDQSTVPASTPTVTSAPTPVAATPAPVSPNMRTAARIKELDQAFDRVNSQPLGEAEYETLISQYERSIQELSGQTSPRQRALLEQRLNILKFRKDLREQQVALLNNSSTDQQRNQQVLQSVAQVESTRVYSIVGQLQPSTVYNGDSLPLMFRIQSVGTSVPRTLGYIKPDPRFALDSKIGQIVGVIGEASVDKDLKLNVITPVRVDLLQGVPMQQIQQPPVQVPPAPAAAVPASEQPAPRAPAIDITK